jgi:hypothetical protein
MGKKPWGSSSGIDRATDATLAVAVTEERASATEALAVVVTEERASATGASFFAGYSA